MSESGEAWARLLECDGNNHKIAAFMATHEIGEARKLTAGLLQQAYLLGRKDGVTTHPLVMTGPLPQPPTRRVKIAVVVCSKGHWSASGDGNYSGKAEDYDYLWDSLECPCSGPGKGHLVWVEASVPIPPASPVVEGLAAGADPRE